MTDRKLYWELQGVIADIEQGNGFDDACLETIKRVADRLAYPEQAPVAWMSNTNRIYRSRIDAVADGEQLLKPLYAAPPQREWQGLTDEERAEFNKWVLKGAMGVVYAIEAKLKAKNV